MHALKRGLVLALVIVGFVFSQGSESDTLLAQGLELYLSQGCGICHTLSKADSKGVFGPPHDALFVIAQARFQSPDYPGEAASAEAYIRESLLEPSAYIIPGYALTRFHMPAYTHLSQEDLDALIYLLMKP